MTEAEDYEAIRKRVEQRYRQRYAFYTHFAVYTMVNIVLWLIYAATSGSVGELLNLGALAPIVSFPWPLIVMAGWGIGLIVHGMYYFIRYGDGALRRQAAIQREIEREMSLRYAYEKPKNDDGVPMRLTDDGELEPIEDEPDSQIKRKHQ